MIYADNAATTKLDSDAYEAMMHFLKSEYANPSQPYSFSAVSRKEIKKAREIIALCIGAEPDEIFFTSGGTESDNWAMKGTAEYFGRSKAIICSNIEHHAILKTCEALEVQGYPVAYVRSDNQGIIRPDTLRSIIHSPSIVSIMMVNNEIGTIQPIRELAEISHDYGALFHTDAVQAVGHLDINVKQLNVDMLSASAHKFNGPRGIGFLYIKKGSSILPLINGGSQESGYRAGTENVASIIGMATALKNNCSNIVQNADHIKMLVDVFINALQIDYHFNVMNADKYSGICSISFPNINAESLLHLLDLKGIYVSVGAACNSKETQISHVLSAINLNDDEAKGTLRISFGKDNTKDEALLLASTLNLLISKIKSN